MLRLTKSEDGEHWSSISDLMSGLMMIFLLIAIAYMHNIVQGQQKIKKIAVTYQEAQVALYEKLNEEFKEDLPKWQAVIDKETLSIQFFEPDILFQPGKSDVTVKFKEILDDFFPRYLRIIFSDEFKDNIAEVRIEGHTSSEWSTKVNSQDEAYFNNMQLSQERTRSVLFYCYSITKQKIYQDLMKQYVTANGLSSSKVVYNNDGTENKTHSRRVEFRTRTNAENKIVQILDELKND